MHSNSPEIDLGSVVSITADTRNRPNYGVQPVVTISVRHSQEPDEIDIDRLREAIKTYIKIIDRDGQASMEAREKARRKAFNDHACGWHTDEIHYVLHQL